MKKFLRTLMLAAAMLLPFASQAQTTVSIGDASSTTTNYSLPVNMYFNYSLTQQIFTADEIGTAGTISAISFEYTNTSAFTMNNVQLYMMNVSKDNFTSTTDMVAISAADLVWQGAFTAQQDGWVTITLTTPFSYNGQDNLLICMYDSVSGYPGSAFKFRNTSTATDYPGEYLAMAYYSDSYVPDLSNVSTFSGSKTRYTYRNNIQLTITPSGSSICAKPAFLHALDVTAHEATLSWASTTAGNYQIEYKMATDSVWTTATLSDTSYDLSLLQSNTAYDARVKAICGVDDESGYRNVSFTTLISCPAPTGLAAVLTPGDGTVATLNWVDTNATTWELLYGTDADFTGVAPITVTGTPTYSLTGLTAETTLYAKVRAICDVDDESAWSNVITFTPTDAYSITVNDGTTTNSYIPVYGLYVDETSKSQFIIPATDLTSITGGILTQLTFYASQSNVPWTGAEFDVYIKETTETTLSALDDYTTMTQVYSGSLSIVDHLMVINLTTPFVYEGGNLMIGVLQTTSGTYSSSTWYGVVATGASLGGYNSSVSQKNFLPKTTINFIPAGSDMCLPVAGLTATGVTSDEATISWSGSANSYTIYDLTDTSVVATVTDTFYTFSNLNPMTAYAFGVVANCATSESMMMSTSFATACLAVTLPYTEDFEATSSVIGCWSVEGTGNWTIGTGDYSASTGAFSGSTNAKITHGTSGAATKLVSPAFDDVTDGMKVDFAYVMRAWGGDLDELNVYSRVDVDSAWQLVAAYTDAVDTWTVASVIIPGTVYQVAFEFVDGYGYGLGIDSVVFSEMGSDFCFAVTDLTVSAATANSVTLAWTDANNSGASYTIYDMTDTSVVASNVSGTTYTVTGLNAQTTYTFGVTANCSATSSSSIATVSATTECEGGSCNIYIYAQDGYGDGWNYATLSVMQGNDLVDSYSMADQGLYYTTIYDTAVVSVCAGSPIVFNWTSGSYDDEITLEIANSTGTIVFSGNGDDLDGDFLLLDSCNGAPVVVIDTIVLTLAVNDATMGTITPAPGTYTWITGDTVSILATPLAGNIMVGWSMSYSLDGEVITDTLFSYDFGFENPIEFIVDGDLFTPATLTAIFGADLCGDVTTYPYAEGFEQGLGCWTTVNGSSDAQPWNAYNSNEINITPHGGNYVASSWSWNSYAMHANAWLISPKFILPNTTDSLTLSWWERTNANYPDSYSVAISTTTNDTSAFTVVRPSTQAAGTWTMQSIDLTAYAGQSIYVAFHHQDYDENYLFIDDVTLFEGAYVPPAPDTLTVTFAVNNATMGTTTPAPGTYQYYTGQTVSFSATPYAGYHFVGWEWIVDGETDTIGANFISASIDVIDALEFGSSMTFKALFEAGNPDSTTITYAVNDATMGTTVPAPGTYYIYVGNSITATAVPNVGYELEAWNIDLYIEGDYYQTITVDSEDEDFDYQMNFGTLSQDFIDNNVTLTITAEFVPAGSSDEYMTLITAVNNASWGTMTPAPGTHQYEEGDEIHFTVTPNDGYHYESAIISMTYGVYTYDTIVYDDITDPDFDLEVDEYMLGAVIGVTVNFAPNGGSDEYLTLVTAVNDPSMGSITPAPGEHHYYAGETVHLTVTPNEGYHFDNAHLTVTMMGIPVIDSTITMDITDFDITVEEMMLGAYVSVTVNFASNNAIDVAGQLNDLKVYPNPTYGTVNIDADDVVKVDVMDINGRVVTTFENTNSFNISSLSAGTYMLRIETTNGTAVKRVVKK